ncbi:SLBB domain-containing protein [Caenispirillum bisanense]|uniref:Polysaccharide export outer membrane protein n=1 Tax=Caenispirillum bisanense TaxID=414052 RepID=A0A286GZ49_9PROT|nr:SLBB domain-containing protein [Caenispirillum bisanense]SOE00777.1 polysaccharide export outer membrane protein [Caenispirillum bisanense]
MPMRILFVLATLVALALPLVGTQAAEPGTSEAETPHVLVPSDVVVFRVLNQPDLDTEVRVDPSGRVAFPYVGLVEVSGLTTQEAADLIGRRLREAGIINRPEVVASMVGFGSTASVLGAVNSPGVYTLDRPTRLTQILARAGGVSPVAGNTITLRRTEEDGTVRVQTFDLRTLLDAPTTDQNLLVRNNDEVYIPDAPVFYLYGNVNAPGAYPIRRPLTVQQALAVGGGITEIGSESRIRIRRENAAGVVEEYRAELDDPIQPFDTIQVPERIF